MAPSSAAADLWTGRLVGGRWRIRSLLDDSGGMASVCLADDERLPRKAVVKIPKAAQFNAEFAERFAREAFWHAKVENLHVVHILDRGEEAGTPFLVLQYLPGGNLKAWCERSPSILADPRLHYDSWLLPIAQALDAVAAQGIVHRDVKPSNILFDSAGQAYLSDFGIVKAGGDATMTGTGMFIGTLQFMSPEQCDSESKTPLDGRSDQYGLAVTAYQVLSGWKYPVDGDTIVPIVKAKLGLAPLLPPREHDPRIPQAVSDTVMRALATDREARFSSSVEFAEAVLEGFGTLGGRRTTGRGTSPARPPAPDPPTARPVQATVDTAPHQSGPGAGAATGRPQRLGGNDPGQAGPAAAWTPAKRLGAGAVVVALVAAAFLLGRGGGPVDPPRVTTPPVVRVTETGATAAITPPSPPSIPAAVVEPAPAPVVPSPAPEPAPVSRDFEVVENSLGMKLVRLPAGKFQMGSNDGDADEQPLHPVQITRPFLLGQTEVPQGQFARVMGTTPWRGRDYVKDGPEMAATYVSWFDADDFCRKLTEIERRAGRLPAALAYRLPTEAEWEYACRAGTTTRFSFGDDESRLGEYAWFAGNTYAKHAHPVGVRQPNSWRLHDLHGNVYEWCSDWHDDAHYANSPAADPQGPPSFGSARVTRGGSWFGAPTYCRSADRNRASPSYRSDIIGFRVACELE